jgi:hypothetical protein
MVEDYDFPEESEEYEQKEPDSYFKDAQEEIKQLFECNKDQVYYLRQLQVKFEKKYFHWVTNNALEGLVKIHYLKDHRIAKQQGTSTRYFIHRSNRYPLRAINKIEDVIQEYSKDNITRGCGHRAEDLFLKALALRGFMPIDEKVKEYNGKKWTNTDNDLDFVFCRDGISYGCEIKNTLGYIDKDELDIKIEMCSYFGIRPLFIMRYAPKTYNKLIYDNNGFSLIFETQIYELGQDQLVKKIKEIIGFPVICSKSIPDGIIDRFEKWHNTKISVK